jgi:NAD(P)-dependent dehydrogenase (short-subunit alcohol dehydrogenase family)
MGVLDKFRLDGKVALVTGAGKNLGKVIALALAEAGADVAVTSRTPSEIQKVAEEIREKGKRALSIPLDVTDSAQVERGVRQVVSEFGRIDILVNNAAVRSSKTLLELSEAEWRAVIDTNLTGAFLCCKAVGPFMVRQGSGRVINIASVAGLRGSVTHTPYCASKGGLILLTRALALEWAPYNVLVNAVAPGLLGARHSKEILDKWSEGIPLKRPAGLDEIAPLVVYLASDASTYTTGDVIVVDGGVSQSGDRRS